jgi:hypothetical protein
MTTVRDLLRDADPVRHEPHERERDRERLRHDVLAAAARVTVPSRAWFRTPGALLAAVALILVGIVAVGSQSWSRGSATLQAAVRFEARLAETQPAAGLREARVPGSDRVIYLHPQVIVTNDDIAQSRVIQGDGPSHFGVGLEFNPAGAEKMRQATAGHIGGPVALRIDGEVAAAPIVRAVIGTSAVISGDYTRAEAERIVRGIGLTSPRP